VLPHATLSTYGITLSTTLATQNRIRRRSWKGGGHRFGSSLWISTETVTSRLTQSWALQVWLSMGYCTKSRCGQSYTSNFEESSKAGLFFSFGQRMLASQTQSVNRRKLTWLPSAAPQQPHPSDQRSHSFLQVLDRPLAPPCSSPPRPWLLQPS
jgi:hypothetical protein